MQPSRTFLVACCLALSIPAVAQTTQKTLPSSQTVLTPTATTSGFQSDVAAVLGQVQEEMVSLEQAMPQNKFGWRPAKGVRSVAEVYLHAAGAGYFFGKMLGFEIPADMAAQMKTYETSTTDKAKIQKALTDSFAWFGNQVKALPDAELSKTLDVFGHTMSKRALVMIALGHYQEHLGQSIAYARFNGVVPPWSKKGN